MTTLADAIATPAGVTINPSLGRLAAASSKGIALSTEDLAAITALGTKLDTLDGRVDGLETAIAATNTAIASTNTKLDTLNAAVASTAPALIAQADEYETVAASATDQVLGGAGATGDRLAGIIINPATTSPGTVVIKDGSTTIYTFTGGASSVTGLSSIVVGLGIKSVSGAFKITTGANVSVVAVGDFSA
jgi:hypothetical protein